MKVKVCGLSKPDNVKFCIDNGVSYCGFILNYPKSHRFVSNKIATELMSIPKGDTKYVGVLVNPKMNELEKFSNLNLDYFQIYGNYDQNMVEFALAHQLPTRAQAAYFRSDLFDKRKILMNDWADFVTSKIYKESS